MDSQFRTSITYFLREGKENLRDCLRIAFSAAKNHNISKIVIFTSEGVGVRVALDEFCIDPSYSQVRLVAVTFPVGKPFTDATGNPIEVEIPKEFKSELREKGIPIVRAHLPFDPITSSHSSRGSLGRDLSLVSNALNMFGGSMSLCVQAVLMACDAGEVELGEHVISLTSDTAILCQAAPTTRMLRGLAVREILCKPAIYSIGRGENVDQLSMPLRLNGAPELLSADGKPVAPKETERKN